MTEWESCDIRSKLGMLLTADWSDDKHIVALDIMLLKGRGYQKKDIDRIGHLLKDMVDFEYRQALGAMIDTYMDFPEKRPTFCFADMVVFEAIKVLSYPQQIQSAKNIIDRLEFAKRFSGNLEENSKILRLLEEGEVVIAACKALLRELGEEV
ncbi:hypothetical protein [Citrobacter phage Tr1]|nr:hypothetical protein [Citrobacter phage Tr1]